MEQFTASNGLIVKRRPNNAGLNIAKNDDFDLGLITGVTTDQAEALREFFRAEEDERLGRWRSVNNPKYTVSRKTKDELVISHEDGRWWYYHSGPGGHPTNQEIAAVAHEYFDAHPQPKPWHDAKPWETWVVTIDGLEHARTLDEDRELRDPGSSENSWMHIRSDRITAGRRIWPEDAS